jgi:AAA domain/FtsX-like permease family
LWIAAQLTRGRIPFGDQCDPSTVLYLSVENAPAEVVRPRFDDLKGDPSRLLLLKGTNSLTLSDVSKLDAVMTQYVPKLLIVDPLQSFVGARVDMHRSNQTRPVLDGLAKLAEKHRSGILLVRHLTKEDKGRAIHRGLGSIDFTGAVRSEVLAGCLADRPDTRAMVHIKHNLGPPGETKGYLIDRSGQFRWQSGPCNLTAAQLLAAPSRHGEPRKLEEATEWLKRQLKEAKPVVELKKAAAAGGISWASIRRAYYVLGIQTDKVGLQGGWIWSLPPAMLSVRAALGAGRARIARELLLESALLGLIGGVLGIGAATVALRFLVSIGFAEGARLNEVFLDARALLFTLAVSLVCGLFLGTIPAWKYSRCRATVTLVRDAQPVRVGTPAVAVGVGPFLLARVLLSCQISRLSLSPCTRDR